MADTSLYYDILQAARIQILGVSPSNVSPSQVVIRKRLAFWKDHDSLPFICLMPGAERIAEEQFNNNCFVDYPVTVALVTASNFLLEDIAWQLARRQEIRRRLHKALLVGADTVFDCTGYDPDPPFDTSGLDVAFDVSGMRFTFRSSEQREE